MSPHGRSTVHGGRATVTWDAAAADDAITSYVVRGERDGDIVTSRTVAPDRLQARSPGLDDGAYTFSIAAIDEAGEGPAALTETVSVSCRR